MTSTTVSPFCVFCGENVATATDAFVCPQCGLKACSDCFNDGSSDCPDCKVLLIDTSVSHNQTAPAQSSSSQQTTNPTSSNNTGNPPSSNNTGTPPSSNNTGNPSSFNIPVYNVDHNSWQVTGKIYSKEFGPKVIFTSLILMSILVVVGLLFLVLLYTGNISLRNVNSSSLPSVKQISTNIKNAKNNIVNMFNKSTGKRNLVGEWKGVFSNANARLHIEEQSSGGGFCGVMRKGRWLIAIDGSLTKNGEISWKETKVVKGSGWKLGNNWDTLILMVQFQAREMIAILHMDGHSEGYELNNGY